MLYYVGDVYVHRTDNAIKNHWNSTMRRKFEIEEEMRTVQMPDTAAIAYPVSVAYPDSLASPAPGFATLDQVPTGSTGYWPCVPVRDVPSTVAGQKSNPDVVLPDFSEWLGPGMYPPTGPAVTHALAYPSFDLMMSNSLTFQPSSRTASSLYSLVPSESASHSPLTANRVAREPQMIMPHQVACGHPSAIDNSRPPPTQQQPKQASPLLLQQQQMFGRSAAGNSPLLQSGRQSTGDTSLLPQHLMMDFHPCNPDGLAVCSLGVLNVLFLSVICYFCQRYFARTDIL